MDGLTVPDYVSPRHYVDVEMDASYDTMSLPLVGLMTGASGGMGLGKSLSA